VKGESLKQDTGRQKKRWEQLKGKKEPKEILLRKNPVNATRDRGKEKIDAMRRATAVPPFLECAPGCPTKLRP